MAHPYTQQSIADFLGWTKPSGEPQDKVGTALTALQLIEEEVLTLTAAVVEAYVFWLFEQPCAVTGDLSLRSKSRIACSTYSLLVIRTWVARRLSSSIVSGLSVNIAFFLPSGLRPAPGRRLRGLGVSIGFCILA